MLDGGVEPGLWKEARLLRQKASSATLNLPPGGLQAGGLVVEPHGLRHATFLSKLSLLRSQGAQGLTPLLSHFMTLPWGAEHCLSQLPACCNVSFHC